MNDLHSTYKSISPALGVSRERPIARYKRIDDEGIMNGSAQLNGSGNWAGFEIIGGHIEHWNMPGAVQTDLFVITNNLRGNWALSVR